MKTNASKVEAFVHLLIILAGDESDAGNPLFTDFTLAGQKLEQLGFTYYKGTVLVIDSLKMEM